MSQLKLFIWTKIGSEKYVLLKSIIEIPAAKI